MIRIGVAVSPGERQPFSVRCSQCASIIRGQLLTTEDARVAVELRDARIIPETASEHWQVITTHPAFPFTPSTELSPFIGIMGILGDAAIPYFQAVNQFNTVAAGDWSHLERAYQFYLTEDWGRFDGAMSRLMEEEWPDQPTMLIRHDLIHRLLTMLFLPLDPVGVYAEAKREIWGRAKPSRELVSHLQKSHVQAKLVALQRRLFHQLNNLVETRQTWLPALAFLWLNRLGLDAPDHWRLPGEDFMILRDAYRQNFELSCQALELVVMAQNSSEGRPAETIHRDGERSPWIPGALSSTPTPPRTLAQFRRLSAEKKIAYLDRFPVTQAGWRDIFNRGLRNAIAHADADAVMSKGQIATGKGITVPYIRFVESVIKQLQMLLLWLDLAKLFRMYGTLAGRESVT